MQIRTSTAVCRRIALTSPAGDGLHVHLSRPRGRTARTSCALLDKLQDRGLTSARGSPCGGEVPGRRALEPHCARGRALERDGEQRVDVAVTMSKLWRVARWPSRKSASRATPCAGGRWAHAVTQADGLHDDLYDVKSWVGRRETRELRCLRILSFHLFLTPQSEGLPKLRGSPSGSSSAS
jgi:hypothetical protein